MNGQSLDSTILSLLRQPGGNEGLEAPAHWSRNLKGVSNSAKSPGRAYPDRLFETAPPLNATTVAITATYTLRQFTSADAGIVAAWVDSAQTRRWVSPSASGPITADVVNEWLKPGGRAFVLTNRDVATPVGYGEINPMRSYRDHDWLGHLIVRPNERGRGIGRVLVVELLRHAFGERGVRKVSLVVFPGNLPAIRCYLAVGFHMRGEEFHRFGGSSRAHRLIHLQMDRDCFESMNPFGNVGASIG